MKFSDFCIERFTNFFWSGRDIKPEKGIKILAVHSDYLIWHGSTVPEIVSSNILKNTRLFRSMREQ